MFMKTLEQFIKDNEGQFVEVAGSSNAKNQCVDCVNAYIRDVLGNPIIEWTNAIDFKNKTNGLYDIVENDLNNPNLVPDVGDIVVYKSPDGIGHIGVCIVKGNATQFGIFEENWPVGSPCKSVLDKKYIIGKYIVSYWMKPKNAIIDDMTDKEKLLLGLINENGLSEGDIRWLIDLKKNQTVSKLEEQINHFKDLEHEYEVEKQSLLTEILENQKEIVTWQSNYESASEQFSIVTEQLENMTEDRNKYRRLYEAQLNNTLTTTDYFRLFIKSLFKK